LGHLTLVEFDWWQFCSLVVRRAHIFNGDINILILSNFVRREISCDAVALVYAGCHLAYTAQILIECVVRITAITDSVILRILVLLPPPCFYSQLNIACINGASAVPTDLLLISGDGAA